MKRAPLLCSDGTVWSETELVEAGNIILRLIEDPAEIWFMLKFIAHGPDEFLLIDIFRSAEQGQVDAHVATAAQNLLHVGRKPMSLCNACNDCIGGEQVGDIGRRQRVEFKCPKVIVGMIAMALNAFELSAEICYTCHQIGTAVMPSFDVSELEAHGGRKSHSHLVYPEIAPQPLRRHGRVCRQLSQDRSCSLIGPLLGFGGEQTLQGLTCIRLP